MNDEPLATDVRPVGLAEAARLVKLSKRAILRLARTTRRRSPYHLTVFPGPNGPLFHPGECRRFAWIADALRGDGASESKS